LFTQALRISIFFPERGLTTLWQIKLRKEVLWPAELFHGDWKQIYPRNPLNHHSVPPGKTAILPSTLKGDSMIIILDLGNELGDPLAVWKLSRENISPLFALYIKGCSPTIYRCLKNWEVDTD
jgi:hypothetical protein